MLSFDTNINVKQIIFSAVGKIYNSQKLDGRSHFAPPKYRGLVSMLKYAVLKRHTCTILGAVLHSEIGWYVVEAPTEFSENDL